ncbi:hypothetical protein L1077_20675 [Pseudoalteromonas luteoviolacea]|uniref:Uncharacterized protein n=1 Tax=Pseudoalteromonas luteoviolacea H33 TaxID=1365251 RepID=A0A167AI52_9GAMM|nr:hypothetical protein [Pseudoalteromonas luteoviolacea]KZN45412.1 hypothetical protein N476_05180 [Pseudoalteromonas luteoviolacea H33]KZN70724.1 hypothetical protein N477_04860 [Pseudoalteromonas luteoviolacea H33-S]MBQ4879140.1 hypothetical protein [Pseudoalteromonas luteoviolacea]MBQ4908105.1 hypothetical protein [Pseudoalteromonas luteoviolacea]MCF6441855.1 hypothetical protein [Pseudoalteromonas luteoviolacea]
MKLSLNKKSMKSLTKTNKNLPQELTDKVAGGFRTDWRDCTGTTYGCHSFGTCHSRLC